LSYNQANVEIILCQNYLVTSLTGLLCFFFFKAGTVGVAVVYTFN